MHCGSTLLLLQTDVSTQKASEGNAVFKISAPIPVVSECGSSVSLYTDSGPLSNLL